MERDRIQSAYHVLVADVQAKIKDDVSAPDGEQGESGDNGAGNSQERGRLK